MKRHLHLAAAVILVLCCICGTGAAQEKITLLPSCVHHEHDAACGGMVNLCAYICRTCVREIQAMIDVLPAPSEPIANSERAALIEQLNAIDAKKWLISDAARAEINFMRYELTALRLAPPYKGVAFLGIEKICTGDIPPDVSAPVVSAVSGHRGAEFYPFGEAQPVDEIMPQPNGSGAAACISPGQYAFSESGYMAPGYQCETNLLVNGMQAQKALGYLATWNVTFEAGQSYHLQLINHYTRIPAAAEGENPADALPYTGDDSSAVLCGAIAAVCALGAWLLRGKRKDQK